MHAGSILASLLAVAALAGPCGAATELAVFGIYDDEAMTQSIGSMEGSYKVVYAGVRALEEPLEFTGLEFSIAGLEAFDAVLVDWPSAPSVVVGTIAAPADTTTGTGGVDAAWPTCQVGDRLILRLQLLAATPPQHQALQVRRHYPPNPYMPYVWGATCDDPCFGCHVRFVTPEYVLNPVVGIEAGGWGAVKGLYR
jgi:hypothetical protein